MKANTDEDMALMLKQRGNLTEPSEAEETNILKKFYSSKSSWVYCPQGVDFRTLNSRRTQTVEIVQPDPAAVCSWTDAGRMFCVGHSPCRALPAGLPEPLPVYEQLQRRMPMTRAEVTEERIIKAPVGGPSPRLDFAMDGAGNQLLKRPTHKRHYTPLMPTSPLMSQLVPSSPRAASESNRLLSFSARPPRANTGSPSRSGKGDPETPGIKKSLRNKESLKKRRFHSSQKQQDQTDPEDHEAASSQTLETDE
jgi:hypothetical protein